MKYFHSIGLFVAVTAALYMTRAVWKDADYQRYAAGSKPERGDKGGGFFS